jgi:hypothetical protein
LPERFGRSCAAGRAVRDDADTMAAHHLSAREIDYVAEKSAHGRAQNVKNIHGIPAPGTGISPNAPHSRRLAVRYTGKSK